MTPRDVKLVPRPNPLPTGLAGWIKTFAQNTMLSGFDPAKTDQLVSNVVEMCRPAMYWSTDNVGMGVKPVKEDGEHGWEVMYVRLRGIATLDG